ncbi:unnamed protein product [Paramecium sonneborni]|uniref:Uncharacterized protein n=1 Tax=Paramecium sonneborni TaxID=65129 RepID=A0A8S1N6R6_9CILI|nr:unnamed protein product [Paramecium sonneborni]
MYWTFISKRVLQDLESLPNSIPVHKTINNQTSKINHSFELDSIKYYSASKIRCQSTHEISEKMVTSKYQRFHDIQIEFPMVRKRRLANILSNPNDYCQRTRPGKKATLAGTILKKYKDIRLSNPNNDKILQSSFYTQDMMGSRRSINMIQSQQKLMDRQCSNGSSSPKIPTTISPITPITPTTSKQQQQYIIRSKLGQSVDLEKIKPPRQLQPLSDILSCSPRAATRQEALKISHHKTNSSHSTNSLYIMNKVYGNVKNKNLPKSIFKVK